MARTPEPVVERAPCRRRTAEQLAALLLAGIVCACDEGASSSLNGNNVPSLLVEVTEIAEKEICEPILGTGTIAAAKTTDLGPRVDGIIEEVFVEVGDRVEKGTPLFRTRQVDYRILLQRAEADFRLARADDKKAERDLERARTLSGRGVLSADQLEAAETRHEITVARVQSASAMVDRARQDLRDTVVTAPYDGVVTRRLVDEGVMMRSLMSAGFPVAQIMKTDVLEAIVHVPELHLRQIEIGMPARLHIDGLERQVETSVHILNDLVDPATHTVEVRLLIPNPDLSVKPGLFVKAELEPAPRTVRVIERGAVLGFGEERYVFVEQDSRAVRRPIRVRDLDLLRLEVLTGVEPGERALIGPTLPRVTDGARVQVRPSANESPHVAL